MISTEDKLLTDCHPLNITWNEYITDCEKAVNTSDLHSDEWSTDDENLAKTEKDQNKRPDRLVNSKSVIKIRDKKWRSTRVSTDVKSFFKNIILILCNITITFIFFIRLKKY
jgi:hypothetical protein